MIYLGSDHTGFEVKGKLKEFLEKMGYEVEDCGAFEVDPDDDYPDFIGAAAEKVSKDPQSFGIVIGGSGQGEAIVANKYPNVRCALFYSPAVPARAVDVTGRKSSDPFEILKLTRNHNHANILSIGIRFLNDDDILQAVKIWLEEPVSDEPRHKRRVEKIKKIEESL
jgi:ribose 5-phosphate isomerase B